MIIWIATGLRLTTTTTASSIPSSQVCDNDIIIFPIKNAPAEHYAHDLRALDDRSADHGVHPHLDHAPGQPQTIIHLPLA